MKQIISILTISLLFSLNITPVQAKCNAECKEQRVVEEKNRNMAQERIRSEREYRIAMIGANNKSLREAKTEAQYIYNTKPQEKQIRQKEINELEKIVKQANKQIKEQEAKENNRIRQIFKIKRQKNDE